VAYPKSFKDMLDIKMPKYVWRVRDLKVGDLISFSSRKINSILILGVRNLSPRYPNLVELDCLVSEPEQEPKRRLIRAFREDTAEGLIGIWDPGF
jgi:hypothetical protein